MTTRPKTAAALFAALIALAITMLSVADAQSGIDADPDDWTHIAGSCDTNTSGVPNNLSGITSDASGDIFGVTNGNGSLFQISGTNSNQVGTAIADPNDVLTGYDTEGIAWIDSSFTPSNADDFFAVAWERDPGNTVESGITIVQVSPNASGVDEITEVDKVSLQGISNGDGAGNRGLEGLAFAVDESSATRWVFYGVKETPAALFRIVYSVPFMSATTFSQGPLDVGDAAGIVIDPSDSTKGYVLTEVGVNEIIEVNLSDGTTVASAGTLSPDAGGCFIQPEGITTEPVSYTHLTLPTTPYV